MGRYLLRLVEIVRDRKRLMVIYCDLQGLIEIWEINRTTRNLELETRNWEL